MLRCMSLTRRYWEVDSMIVESSEQVATIRETILHNAEKSMVVLKKCADDLPAMQFFAELKFGKMGRDPLTGRELNMIEQINQMYSDIVALSAVQDLLDQYPGKKFEMHLGSTAGYDIQSTDGEVIAECFAVTSVNSNDKINKDCRKLRKAQALYKHLYFCTYRDSEKVLQNKFEKYPEIQLKRVYY